MKVYVADSGSEPKRVVANRLAKLLGAEIVDSAKVGKATEFFTDDFRVIRVY